MRTLACPERRFLVSGVMQGCAKLLDLVALMIVIAIVFLLMNMERTKAKSHNDALILVKNLR